MDVQILDARSYFDVILYTTKSVLDKNGFMDRPNRDESGLFTLMIYREGLIIAWFHQIFRRFV